MWGVIRAWRENASSAMTPAGAALDDLALDPGGAGRAIRAPVPDPEPPDIDRHGLAPALAAAAAARGFLDRIVVSGCVKRWRE